MENIKIKGLEDGDLSKFSLKKLNGIELGNNNKKSGHLKNISSKGAVARYEKYGNPAEGKYGKPILQYDLNGKFIKEWKGAFLAAQHYGVENIVISDVVGGRRDSAVGFMWKKKTSEFFEKQIQSWYEIQNPTCPHCKKIVSKGMYKRWHGDNCKQK